MNKKSGKKNEPFQKKKIPFKKGDNKMEKWVWFALAVVVITTFAIYFNAIRFNILYSWDDNVYIRENNDILSLHWANIKLFFTKFYAGNYHPLTILTYALEYNIGSGKPSILHFNNILLHIVNTCLVFVLIRKISPKNAIVALITAAFFAVHPVHVESVAWVSERKDVLYSFFFLLSLIMYMDYLKLHKAKHMFYSAVFFLLSCLSKSAAVILPLVMVLLDYYTDRKFTWKMMLEKVPFFLISLIFGLLAIYSQKSVGVIQNWAPNMSAVEHLSVVCFSFISYLFKALIPVGLSAIYPYPLELGSTLPLMYYISILLVGLLFYLVWYSRKWGKDVIFGFLFFVITIILVLQILSVGAATMADRYTYIPYIGVFFMVGKLYENISVSLNNTIRKYNNYLLTVLVIGFVTFTAISNDRVDVWTNEDTLFSDVINKYPYSSKAYFMRGGFYIMHDAYEVYANNPKEKEKFLRMAIEDFENTVKYAPVPIEKAKAYYNLGFAKYDLTDLKGAADDCSKSIDIDSTYSKPLICRGNCYRNYYANTLYANDAILKENYLKKAITDYEKALKYETVIKDKAVAYCNIGACKGDLGDREGAIKDFDDAVKNDNNYAIAYYNRGNQYYLLRDYQNALEDYNKAIELNPRDNNAIKNRDIVKSILKNLKPA